jgi:tRNA uridine 5-carboxymethylaminomethyl modification enzyme
LLEKVSDHEGARGVIESLGSDSNGVTLAQLLKRPEIQIEQLAPLLARLMPAFFAREGLTSDQLPGTRNPPELSTIHHPPSTDFRLPAEIRNELKSVETEIKYAGYLDQQTKSIERLKRSEQRAIPDWFDYGKVSGLSREMNEKLVRVRPRTLGQASRIPGVTPAAVSLINVFIEIQSRQQRPANAGHLYWMSFVGCTIVSLIANCWLLIASYSIASSAAIVSIPSHKFCSRTFSFDEC